MSAPPPQPSVADMTEKNVQTQAQNSRPRSQSMSQKSDDSHTAADFIRDQMQMEADAREAMPYSIENCTKPLGSLRQNIFACLTCNPPPESLTEPFSPAGVCYSCSVQCHGEHELVEIFQKRNFTCDCGTTRFSPDQCCTLRINPKTNTKGGVHSEAPEAANKYNQNFRNRFCSCCIDYKADEQKGTMFQCLGLGSAETGGCGEDWYHPGCLMGLGPKWYEGMPGRKGKSSKAAVTDGGLASISEDAAPEDGQGNDISDQPQEEDENDVPLPDGFPGEDDFDHLICYKCVEANPWIKRYAGSNGFLSPLFFKKAAEGEIDSKKRKLDEDEDEQKSEPTKRAKSEPFTSEATPAEAVAPDTETETENKTSDETEQAGTKDEEKEEKDTVILFPSCKLETAALPPAHTGQLSLFLLPNFREQFCRCEKCFPTLQTHPQLLEEEESYEPPLTDDASDNGSVSNNSLLERGESALKNVDRVRAIEGVMAYNHLKDKLTPFFKQFADSGQAVGAEDIKEYFAKLRGDEQAIKDAGEGAKEDSRKEQSGY